MEKTVIVTGASSGIGYAIAHELSKNYQVIATYNNGKEKIEKLKEEIKNKYDKDIDIFKLDLKNEEDIETFVKEVINKYNHIDCLVNNAGIAIDKPLLEKTKSEFLEVMDANLIGPFLLTKLVSKEMIKQGSGKIVNIASTNGIDTLYPESCDYDASKAGVISLTHNFAKELSPIINVNAIAPGWIDTPMNSDLDKDFKEEEQKKIFLNRFGKPEEVAFLVEFLLSDKANYINNEVIRIDGGM